MSALQFDVVGIGNAIVDVVATTTSAFLEQHDLAKGRMILIDDATATRIYGAMGQAIEYSGGSAARQTQQHARPRRACSGQSRLSEILGQA